MPAKTAYSFDVLGRVKYVQRPDDVFEQIDYGALNFSSLPAKTSDARV